jgi:hypothetical protein
MSVIVHYYIQKGAEEERVVKFQEFAEIRDKLLQAHPPMAFTIGDTHGRMEFEIVDDLGDEDGEAT